MKALHSALVCAAAFTLSACATEHHHYNDGKVMPNAHPHDATVHPGHLHPHPNPYVEPRDVNKYEVFCPPKQVEMGQC